jgi:3-oxoacyl-[acyl-carrier protein] reductase
MDLGLKGKVAVVTAASRGLGLAAAKELAREGARLAICARSERVEAAAAEIRQQTGAEVLAQQADLTLASEVERFAETTLRRFDAVDILVLNSGGPPSGKFLDLAPEDWEKAFQLVVMSAVRTCYAFVPAMAGRGTGSIVASQSYSVKQPIDNLTLSNALRVAVVGLMKSLASELGPLGIRVNSIHPGWTRTERVRELLRDRAARSGQSPEAEAEKITAEVPLRRMAEVEEYGRAVAWLASPAASYLHGHALLYDGGISKATL